MKLLHARRLAVVAASIAACVTVTAQIPDSQDAARAAWRFRRPVASATGATGAGFMAVTIPPEVAERSQPSLADLRFVSADGREVPYVLDIDIPRTAERRRSGRLVEQQHERRRMSAWVVDFETATAFDRLELDIDGADFSKRIDLETSLDGTQWARAGDDAWVFDRPWRGRRIHDTAIEQAAPLTARYVRLTVDDWRSTPVVVRGVTAVLTTHLGGRRWTREAALVRLETPPGRPSRYRIDAPPGAPVERIAIATDDVAFWRDVRVFEVGPRGEEEPVSARQTIYRVRLDDADLDAERLDVDLVRPITAPLIVEIEDGDSPPLARPRVTLSGMERRALIPAAAPLTLYYGNAATRRPVYDIEALRTRLSLVEAYPQGTLGPEAANPRFAPLAPMAFLASRGAVADTSRWTVSRQLRISGGDDVYTLTLSPADLVHLRPDLGDVRVVDGERRQVPYVLEPRAAAARVALTVQTATPRDGAARTSAWELTVPSDRPDAANHSALPLAALDLYFTDGFYTRPAVLLTPDRRAPHGQRVLQQVTLRATRRVAGGTPDPQTFDLGEVRTGTLALEVGNGDNAPLTLRRAEGVVWVPRLTFKAAAGEYRLLFGNAEAAPPTYDLADLRQDVLAYSAIPIEAKALEPPTPNPDYARGARDVLSGLERGPLLWTALGFSILALLWLTKVIVKSPPSPPLP